MLSMEPGRTLRMSRLAALASGSLTRLSRVVDRLDKRGWVCRRPDPTDGRSTLAVLTDAGWEKVVDTAPGHVAEVRRLIFDPLTRSQVRHLQDIGSRVLRAIGTDGLAPPARLTYARGRATFCDRPGVCAVLTAPGRRGQGRAEAAMRAMRTAISGVLVAGLLVVAPGSARAGGDDPAVVTDWNQRAITTLVADTATTPISDFVYLAFVQAAVYDAVVGVTGGYRPYRFRGTAPSGSSAEAAAAAAAHGVLTAYVPSATADLDAAFAASLAKIDAGDPRSARGGLRCAHGSAPREDAAGRRSRRHERRVHGRTGRRGVAADTAGQRGLHVPAPGRRATSAGRQCDTVRAAASAGPDLRALRRGLRRGQGTRASRPGFHPHRGADCHCAVLLRQCARSSSSTAGSGSRF